MKKVLVTGVDGFMGRHLMAAPLDFAPVLHVRHAESWEPWKQKGFDAVLGDLSKGKCLDDAQPVDAVIHLAGRSSGSARELYKNNVVATAAVVEWMARNKVPRILLASTGAVYAGRARGASREGDALGPRSHYAGSKAAAEALVKQAVAESGGNLRAVILRFPHVYGPGNRKGVIWNFLESVLTTGKVPLDGEGTQERDFLYVDDAVAALRAAVRYETAGAVTLNISTGRKTPLAELARLIGLALERPVSAEKSGRPETPPRRIWLDPRAAAKTLKWSAAVPLPIGLQQTAAWRLSLSSG